MAKTVEKKTEKKTKAAPAKTAEAVEKKLHRRTFVGIVVSDKMMKTRVVKVERQVKSGVYGKYINKANKFKAHDENNQSKIGDLVSIIESRPLSKDKRWAIQKIIRVAGSEILTKA